MSQSFFKKLSFFADITPIKRGREVIATRHKKLFGNSTTGFTLMEILLALAIFGVLAASAVVAVSALRSGPDLQAEARGLSRVLELARSKTVASEGDTRYGVYIDTSTNPHQYVLFQTETDYASGVAITTYKLRDTIEFDPLSVSFGGGAEVVFDRLEGTTGQAGSAVLRLKADPSNTMAVSVESSGNVEIDDSPDSIDDCVSDIPPGNRICDSRHVHIDYTRNPPIDTVAETIILNFDSGAKIETIIIADHLSGGQIVWEDTIDVAGEPQTLKIHTHELNNGFDSQFSVHRDKRFNTKALTIALSGDVGTLIQYDAAGVVTAGTSIYADPPIEQ